MIIPTQVIDCMIADSIYFREKQRSMTFCDRDVLRLFAYQYQHNKVYQEFCKSLYKTPENVTAVMDIPFLPVSAFRDYEVKTGKWKADVVFSSSATTGQIPSRHLMPSREKYLSNTRNCFNYHYGNVKDYTVFALLPAYLERKGSSLIAMADFFIKESKDPDSGFFLYDHDKLVLSLNKAKRQNRKILLLGVTFALLDFAEKHRLSLENTIIMETGGMKGRRKEMPRQEVHDYLIKRLGVHKIHSEYGMTEMSSQMYSDGDGIFTVNPLTRVIVHELTDPLSPVQDGKTGTLSIIDLANDHSCAFLRTDDLGKSLGFGKFEVLGRADNSEIRGCNLLVSDLIA